jgi:hypothetical protein
MKNTLNINVIIVGILTLFMIVSIIPTFAQTNVQKVDTVEFSIDFSTPTLKENNDFYEIVVSEANSVTTKEGYPMMPVYSKTFEFPLGTPIISVDITPSMIQTMSVDKQIKPVPLKQNIGDQIILTEGYINKKIYESDEPSPSNWYTISTGAGLNKDNEHVLFVSCHITPVRYLGNAHLLQYISHINIQITYDATPPAPASSGGYSLVVISPSEFSDPLQPLVEHKNTRNVPTILVTLDEIYNSSTGRDNPEKIKYFIKHAVEETSNPIYACILVGGSYSLGPLLCRYLQRQWRFL